MAEPAERDAVGGAGARTVRLCAVGDLASGQARRFDVAGLRVALVRIDDEFHAVGDRCSHEDFSLADGEVWADECEIECSKHGSTFDLRTGEPCSLPATRPVPVYDVVVEGDDVSLVVP
ncbi:MAG: non-heme iron oxygenase ferredoxin subunit [Acidimicrobiales bacterium]